MLRCAREGGVQAGNPLSERRLAQTFGRTSHRQLRTRYALGVRGVPNEILDSSFRAQLCRYAADLTSTRTLPGVVRFQAAQPSRPPSAGTPWAAR
jgi:hypothetical protein